MTDLFAPQDEIAERIVTALQIKLTAGEELRIHRKHTRSFEVWNLLTQGVEYFYRRTNIDNTRARQLFDQAIKADRSYSLAYALLAWTHRFEAQFGWGNRPDLSIERAAFLAEKARALDDELPDVYALLGAIQIYGRRYDEAVASGEKAVALNPNHATTTALLAMFLHNAGKPKEALQKMKRAMRLSPYYSSWFLEELGFIYLDAEQPKEALAVFKKYLERESSGTHAAHAYIGRALSFHVLGHDDAARLEVTKAIEADSEISVTRFGQHNLNQDVEQSKGGFASLGFAGEIMSAYMRHFLSSWL
jgi:adenylate cyclase